MEFRQYDLLKRDKYSVLSAHDQIGRLHRKELIIAHHGGACANPICKRRYNPKEKNCEKWHFAHLLPVRVSEEIFNKGGDWWTWWKDQPAFTDEWWSYVKRVVPTCCLQCNYAVEGGPKELLPMADIAMDNFPTYLMKNVDLFE